MWRSCLRLKDRGRHLLNRPSERKRFYQNVSITQGEGGFEINLDHRKLKTPQAKLFTVPSEALAIAVATEWDSQQDTVKFYTMHLTTLCNTSLDNPTQRNKDQLIRAAVKFLDTDTICYRVEEPETLVELQKNEWDPIIEWAEKRYGVEIGSSTSIMGPNIPTKTREVFISHLASYNMWALQEASSSCMIGLARVICPPASQSRWEFEGCCDWPDSGHVFTQGHAEVGHQKESWSFLSEEWANPRWAWDGFPSRPLPHSLVLFKGARIHKGVGRLSQLPYFQS
uniref:ATP synthase mitochondrial F1 complex assembly factor 2 isoform X3 n=1 Tax=Castor canadensis TaxID=51338 RepID=A0A8B7UBA5_CASCN|nr:ATP synthase mitochondrial F1 complex assembly factor 2 isoform X3 [Castor canadensis]